MAQLILFISFNSLVILDLNEKVLSKWADAKLSKSDKLYVSGLFYNVVKCQFY